MGTKITWVVVVAVVALLLLYGGNRRVATTVSLRNESNATLTDVRIALADTEIWTGRMAPDEEKSARGRPAGDGAVRISFQAQGRSFRGTFGRVAAHVGDDYDFVVTPDFEIRPTPPP